jgi:hypothetical protein
MYHRLSYLIGSERIQLSPSIIGGHVDFGLVDESDNLDISRRSRELDSCNGASGNYSRAVARVGAPCDFSGLGIGDERVWGGRAPYAKVLARMMLDKTSKRNSLKNADPQYC